MIPWERSGEAGRGQFSEIPAHNSVMHPAEATATDPHQRARDVARLANFLDSCIPIPGTKWSIGAESVLGLIPGVGDLAGLIIGLVVVNQARVAGAPPALLRRMTANVL